MYTQSITQKVRWKLWPRQTKQKTCITHRLWNILNITRNSKNATIYATRSTTNWSFVKTFDEHFENLHHQIQVTRINCFEPKKRNRALREAKTGKHECCNITAMYTAVFLLTYFRLTKGRVIFFLPEIAVANFLHLMVLLCKEYVGECLSECYLK